MLNILSRLPASALVASSLVCRQWYRIAQAPQLWQRHCMEAFTRSDACENERLVRIAYACERHIILPQGRHLFCTSSQLFDVVHNAVVIKVCLICSRALQGSVASRTA